MEAETRSAVGLYGLGSRAEDLAFPRYSGEAFFLDIQAFHYCRRLHAWALPPDACGFALSPLSFPFAPLPDPLFSSDMLQVLVLIFTHGLAFSPEEAEFRGDPSSFGSLARLYKQILVVAFGFLGFQEANRFSNFRSVSGLHRSW